MIAANIYCGPDDLIDILSQSAVDLRSDDNPPSAYGGAVARAGNEIDRYCLRAYDPSQLVQSPSIADCAAWLAAYFLCSRRGNSPPASVAARREEFIKWLVRVRSGADEIPGIARRNSYAPVMSSMRATLRPFPRAVVERSLSSQAGQHFGAAPVNYHVHQDAWERFGWDGIWM